MEPTELPALLEALLFVSDQPLTVAALIKSVDDEGVGAPEVKAALDELGRRYEAGESGVQLTRFGRGYQIVTRERFSPWVEGLVSGRRKMRLSRAALETAAVIAYKQPIARLEVERIRGVDAGGVVNTLLERGLIMIKGRDPGPGRPHLYGTTQAFLDYFGLSRLSDLPRLEELAVLARKEESSTWDETELARFEKHGVESDDVPEPWTAGEPPSGGEEAPPEAAAGAQEEDRIEFRQVVDDLAGSGFPAGAGREEDDPHGREGSPATEGAEDDEAEAENPVPPGP